jgi:uncharacterized coiled-coil DUF342 family protein
MPKAPRSTAAVLKSMESGGRYSRAEAQELINEIESWKDCAEALASKLTDLADVDIDLNMDGLEDIKLDGVDYKDVAAAIETLNNAQDSALAAKEAVEEFIEAWEEMRDYAETWSEGEAEKDEIEDARNEMEGCAANLREKLDALTEMGIDVTDV